MTNKLIRILIYMVVAGLIYWLGCLLLAAFHAPAVFITIWMVIVMLIVLLAILRLLGITPP